jgi:E3 ubiquitin-protein ligase HUWE1
MRIKSRRAVEPPEAIRSAIDAVLAQPLDALGDALQGFTWEFESKGDVHHWIPLLDRFDAYFEAHLKSRRDLSLAPPPPAAAAGAGVGSSGSAAPAAAAQQPAAAAAEDPPFPAAALLQILRVTALILEGCSNKHLYNSYEYLSLLLAAPDSAVVLAALQTLAACVRKSSAPTARWAGAEDLNARLLVLAGGWGGGDDAPDLLACASGAPLQSAPTSLHFQFYAKPAEGAASAAGAAGAAGGLRVIDLPAIDRLPESDHELLERLVREHDVPADKRFALLHKIRVARAFGGDSEARRALLRTRLLAFYVAFQSNPSPTDIMALFAGAPEFVQQLAAVLRSEGQVPDDLLTLALRALAVQLLDRARHGAVVAAISGGEGSGLLALLIHRAVASLTGREAVPAPYSQPFVEALLSMVGALVTSTSGTTALSDASLVPALLPLLSHHNPAHLTLVASTVRILESFMDYK